MKKLTRTLKCMGAIVLALALAITPMPGKTADVKAAVKDSFVVNIKGYDGHAKITLERKEMKTEVETTTAAEGNEDNPEPSESKKSITTEEGKATFESFVDTDYYYDLEITGMKTGSGREYKDIKKSKISFSGDSYETDENDLIKQIEISGKVVGELLDSDDTKPLSGVKVKYGSGSDDYVTTKNDGKYSFYVWEGETFSIKYSTDEEGYSEEPTKPNLKYYEDEELEDVEIKLNTVSLTNASGKKIYINDIERSDNTSISLKYGKSASVVVFPDFGKNVNNLYLKINGSTQKTFSESTDVYMSGKHGYKFDIGSIKKSYDITYDQSSPDDQGTFYVMKGQTSKKIGYSPSDNNYKYAYALKEDDVESTTHYDAHSQVTLSIDVDAINSNTPHKLVYYIYKIKGNGDVAGTCGSVTVYRDSKAPTNIEFNIEKAYSAIDILSSNIHLMPYNKKIEVKVTASDVCDSDEEVSGLDMMRLFEAPGATSDDTSSAFNYTATFNNGEASIEVPLINITNNGWYLNKVLRVAVTDNAGNTEYKTYTSNASDNNTLTNVMLIENKAPIFEDPIITPLDPDKQGQSGKYIQCDSEIRITAYDEEGENSIQDADSDESGALLESNRYSGMHSIIVLDGNDGNKEIDTTVISKSDFGGDKQTLTVKIDTTELKCIEGEYKLKFKAIDNASNGTISEEVNLLKDTKAPFVDKMTFVSTGYKNDDEVIDKETDPTFFKENVQVSDDYGYYFRKKAIVRIYTKDVKTDESSASGVESIEYYTEDTKGNIVQGVITDIKKEDGYYIGEFTIDQYFKGRIYAKATDKVGNTVDDYVTPEGTILETEDQHDKQETEDKIKHIEFKPETTGRTDEDGKHKLYSKNTKLGLVITDTYSGIRQVDIAISSKYDDKKEAGSLTIDNAGKEIKKSEYLGDVKGANKKEYNLKTAKSWEIDPKSTESNIVTKIDNQLIISNNCNDIKISVKLTDRAGNVSEKSYVLSIDKTAPKLVVKMADNDDSQFTGYFKTNRKYDVYLYERNIDKKQIEMKTVRKDDYDSDHKKFLSTNFKQIGETMLDGAQVYVYKKSGTFKAEGDYTFTIKATDLANNKTSNSKVKYSKKVKTKKKTSKKNTQQTNTKTNTKVNADNNKVLDYKKENDKDRKIDTSFTIDKTTPKVTVTYDNNNAVNGKYFPQARTATIKIKEHNFTKEHNRIVINRKAYKDGSAISGAPISGWKEGDTNVYKATIPYTQDGDYQFGIDVTDKAGNKVSDSGVNYPNGRELSKDFVIDQTVEKPIIGGVENGKSYPEKCIPTIQVNDTNYESSEVKLLRTQKDDIDRDVTSKYIKSMPANGSTVSENYFDKLKANDGIYKLRVDITDMAGNTDSEEVSFTVNRFGSVYEFSKDLVDLQDSYVNKVDGDIYIREFNPDRLVEDSVEMEVQRDQEPVEKVDYDVSPEVNKKVEIGSSGWYQYKYDIGNDNFKKDGIYTVNVKTKDDAGNTPESNNQSEIRFSVDTEKPDIVNVKGMESASVNAKEQKVDYLIHDSIGLKSIVVTVDGKEVANVADFADPTNYEGNFVIKEGYERKVNFKITDLAGNVTNTADTDFNPEFDFNSTITVSTNIFLLWFANKWLFFGSLIGLVAIAAAIAYLIRRKMAGKIL